MAAPLGNKNAVGSKGGGRAKAGDIAFLVDVWNGDYELDDLKKGSLSGKYMFVRKLREGDDKVLAQLVNKLFANNIPTKNVPHL